MASVSKTLVLVAAAAFGGLSLPAAGVDALCPPKAGDVDVHGRVADVQSAFFGHRIFGDFAKKEIWGEAHEAFAHPDDDVFNKGIGMWKGEFWGKLMISACRVAAYSHDEKLKEFLRQEALSLIRFQHPDGYLGTYVDKEYVTPLPPEEAKRRIGWPCTYNWSLWCRKYTLWGLLACYRLTGEKALLDAADRAMTQQIDMLHRRGLRLCDTGTSAMRGLPPCSILKPLLWLYQDTGKRKFLDYAEEIMRDFNDPNCRAPQFAANLAADKPIQDWYPSENGQWGKAYEMMSCLAGFVEYYRVTGDRAALDVAVKMRDRILKDELNLCLSVGYNDQFWGARRFLNGVSEPCDAVHWIRLNHELWLVTGEAKYVDSIEETFYNPFLAAIAPDGSWGARSVRSHGRHQKAPPQSGMKLQHCCVNNLPRGFMDAAETMAAKGRDGVLHVALYHDAAVRVGGDKVDISGGFPLNGTVTVTLEKQAAGIVRFRVPAWCPSLTVKSGADVRRATQSGWFEVRAPQGRSVWTLGFDMNPRIVDSDRESVEAYEKHGPLASRWAVNWDDKSDERNLVPLLRKTPSAQIMWGPLMLAKSVRLGATEAEILDPQTVNRGGWSLKLEPLADEKDIWGAWKAVFRKGPESREFKVCDYSSASVWSDKDIEFSVFF